MSQSVHFLFAALIFLAVVIYHFASQKLMKLENNRWFNWLVLSGFLNLVSGIVCSVLLSLEHPVSDGLMEVLLTVQLLLEITVPHALLIYLISQFVTRAKDRHWLIFPLVLFPGLMAMAVLSNFFTNLFFTVEQGVCTMGPFRGALYGYSGLNLAAILILTVSHRKEISRYKFMAIWEMAVLVAASTLFRVIYGTAHVELLSGIVSTLSITVLFLTLNNPYKCVDGLTSVYDDHFFHERCKNRLDRHKEFHVLTVTLNQLRHINFVLGMEAGNQVLAETAHMLQNCSKKNLVFRVSGKRFLVMCPTILELQKVRNRALDFFFQPLQLGQETVEPHAILGTITHAEKLGSSNDVLAYGVHLARMAKWPFETCLVQGNEKSLESYRYNQEVESFMQTALQENLFSVVFQPVYSLEDQRYTTMEVLSRLNHPTLGWVSPAIFIDIAERNDQIAQISLLQLERVCRFLENNEKIMEEFQSVKVNVSPVELLKRGHVDSMLDIIKKHHLPLEFFQFEITESTAVEHGQLLDDVVKQFTQAGIGLCLDDFGSGYANLNAVMKLPFHTIKLDRSLLFGITQDCRVASLYQSLVVSLHNLGFHVLSEGVETDQELELVSQWGVDMIQGFYFSRPLAGKKLLSDIVLAQE